MNICIGDIRLLIVAATLAVVGCADAPSAPGVPLRPGQPRVLAIKASTYDGSGQAVHPDVAMLPANGSQPATPFLALTPYPFGNPTYENPSIYTGDGLARWSAPFGETNPVVQPQSGAYLSDPDMLYDPATSELWLYYRQVTSENDIWLVRSGDGVRWSTPVLVTHAPNHEIVSPAVVRRGSGDWLMWSVNSGAVGCGAVATSVELRRSSDGLAWSPPETVALDESHGSPWHLEVEWIASRQEFWALFPVKEPGSCTTAAVYFARSDDGLHWQTYPTPLLVRGVTPELQDVVYRSSLAYDPEAQSVTVWYSGARFSGSEYVWHVAVEQLPLASFMARVSAMSTTAPPTVTSAPPLTNETAP